MHLESYFDVLTPDDIRLKGTRIGIETVLYDFIHRGNSPQKIADRYPSLTLEQVFATITYYLHDKEKIGAYLANWIEHGRKMRAEQERRPPSILTRLRKIAEDRESAQLRNAAS